MPPHYDLTKPAGLIALLRGRGEHYLDHIPVAPTPAFTERMHCGRCLAVMRHYVHLEIARGGGTPVNYAGSDPVAAFCPAVFVYQCTECRTRTYAVLIVTSDRERHLSLIPIRDGLRTPNTPEHVAYWLDQARRAESAGAVSLAAAGYRVAIDQLLLEQGYKGRMLGNKIQALETARSAGTAKPWAERFDLELLRCLKALGDGTLHADDVDLSRLAAIDSDLLRAIEATLSILLDLVYEEPRRAEERVARLTAAREIVKPPKG